MIFDEMTPTWIAIGGALMCFIFGMINGYLLGKSKAVSENYLNGEKRKCNLGKANKRRNP